MKINNDRKIYGIKKTPKFTLLERKEERKACARRRKSSSL